VWVKGQGNNRATICDFLGAIEKSLMSFMNAIEDSDDYNAGLGHG
jgi:hypothetical protein